MPFLCSLTPIAIATTATLTAFIAALACATPAATAAPVKLHFDWPDDLQAQVTVTRSRNRSGVAPIVATVGYDMAVKKKATQGIAIGYSNLRVIALNGRNDVPEVERIQTEFMARVGLPTILVGNDGEFDRIDDALTFRDQLFKLFAQFQPAPFNDPRQRSALEQMTSEAVLNAGAAGEWRQLVGVWRHTPLEPGELYSIDFQGQTPLLPGRSLPMRYEFTLLNEQPCTRAGTPRRCVEIEMRTIIDRAAFEAAVLQFARPNGQAPAKDAETLDSMNIEQSQRLVTEPDGLIPHRLETRRHISTVTRARDGQKKTSGDLQETTMRFEYPRKP